ncbi:MAG: hypothetical protein GX850_05560 [Clostridiaceae bacterium]|nr:hypothetical protein [Clostridiaceae bacterium]
MRHNQTNRSALPARNKAETLNWDRVLETYKALKELPEELPVSEGERERILAVYNRALEQAGTGHNDVAMIALEKLTSGWPQFSQAASLYGVLLAKERRYREAEEQFDKVLLASPDSALATTVDKCRMAAREERIREQARDSSKKRNEHVLMPVRASMAKSGILQRAADEDGTGRIQMAGRREQEEAYRMAQNKTSDTSRTQGNVVRLIQGLTLAVITASLLFLIFYFAIRPIILKNEARRERLEWMEKILEERESENESVAEILDMYRKTFPPIDGK